MEVEEGKRPRRGEKTQAEKEELSRATAWSWNLGDRERRKAKTWKGRYHRAAKQSKPPTPEGEIRAGLCGKRGLKRSAVGAQGSGREPAGPAGAAAHIEHNLPLASYTWI